MPDKSDEMIGLDRHVIRVTVSHRHYYYLLLMLVL